MAPPHSQDAFMDRGSWVASPNSQRLSMNFRRELVKFQATLDAKEFDLSLGSPLGSYEDATIALIGGKALQCWRLLRHGLPVPASFVVPTYVYSMHLAKAGAADLVNEVFSSNLADAKIREQNKLKLEEIRKRITDTPLDVEVLSNLDKFLESLGEGAVVAVRSSGSAEDLVSQSFAGQYDTFLYKSTREEIVDSIKGCWGSMFKSHILDYATSPAFELADSTNSSETSTVTFKAPQMGVLIMKMVESKAAGVCFTQNLWGSSNEVMIEGVLGQCEGLVGGEITPDRYVLDKQSAKLIYQSLNRPTHKFVRSANMDGVVKVPVDHPKGKPVLSNSQLKELLRIARAIEEYYDRPQDIEWAIDENNKLKILQARQITTLGNTGALSFLPPGEGFWTYDPAHFPRPMTPWFQDVYGFDYAFERGRRMGCLMQRVNMKFIHNFVYYQLIMSPPSPELERAADAYWSKQLYEDDYREFQDFFVPHCTALQDEMRKLNPSAMAHKVLVEHVAHCYDMAKEFWMLHHTYSFTAQVVVGDYMNRMAALTGKDPMETLQLLEGSSPASRGLLNREDPLLDGMYRLLGDNPKAMDLLGVEESNAAWALDCLMHMPGELGTVMRQVVNVYGWRLAGSYDLVTPAVIETPSFFLKTLLSGTKEDSNAQIRAAQKIAKQAQEWKNILPDEKHDEFDAVLDLGRRFFRLRDERGLCTDLSGVGLCRRGLLEAGRRLADHGVIHKPEHICVAHKHEAIALLKGDLSLLSNHKGLAVGPVELPTPLELQRRYDYIFSADPNTIPRSLGTPPLPPDTTALPKNIRRTMNAMGTGSKGIHNDGQDDAEKDIEGNPNVVMGLAASGGLVEGPCCVVLNDGDLKKVKKGDIVVTFSCSASINVILALCAGIVTDYGGMLSHAAIVSREYGIPAVVGTQAATRKFKDGDTIRVDCSTSKVTCVSRK